MRSPASEPADQAQRARALDASRSLLVQAPAGSGKTDLLTRRFLRLLAEVDSPAQVVAITFTRAAAAEMRERILGELEKASDAQEPGAETPIGDPQSMNALAVRALDRSRRLKWDLLDLPSQLRVTTIDAFCHELAARQPLLSAIGGRVSVAERPADLYRRAAQRTIERIDTTDPPLREAIESLLMWRDNSWREMEELIVEMLSRRDQWMQDFVLASGPGLSDSESLELRERLERPFARAVRAGLETVCDKLDRLPDAWDRAMELARFACEQSAGALHRALAERTEWPSAQCRTVEDLEQAREACLCLAKMVLTETGTLRRQINKSHGFPPHRLREKAQMLEFLADLHKVSGLDAALHSLRELPDLRYTEDDWQIVRACFTLLRQAAAELQVVFAEAGAADFIEIAQSAQRALATEDGLPSDGAMASADEIRHLLIDEFQDTSRRQHRLLASIVAAWPDRAKRTLFAVGDPMQSIYFFRDADAELFPRVRAAGLEIANGDSLALEPVRLAANFRTAPALISCLNQMFAHVFAEPDQSGIVFAPSVSARTPSSQACEPMALHLEFVPQASRGPSADPADASPIQSAHERQVAEIVALIRGHLEQIDAARARGETYRVAVLGRARKALAPIAAALREAAIPFRAVDLEGLKDRVEVQDALSLARALLNPQNRVAWLGVLRAPWCGLGIDDLHLLTSSDDEELLARPVPELLEERAPLLPAPGRRAVERVLGALDAWSRLGASLPAGALGTRLEQVWTVIGGADCVDPTARANLGLLWRSLDALPSGEPDLLGPALDDALSKLTALPDSDSDKRCGVQLMTIHKAKGLEFEVVIVPELQASRGRSGLKLLSWLERGLARPDESGDITEFLVAPLQSKGEESGRAKRWVDGAYRAREQEEERRILYVAATRAREELHLFARPTYRVEADGAFTLVEPAQSLLATAWPAVEAEVRTRFESWKAATQQRAQLDIAASADHGTLAPAPLARPKLLRRLPDDYETSSTNRIQPPGVTTRDRVQRPLGRGAAPAEGEAEDRGSFQPETAPFYSRHEGGLASRALGNAVHALMQELARLRLSHDWEDARASIARREPRLAAQARALGIDAAQARAIAAKALRYTLAVTQDPTGKWILSPHTEAASEVAWVGAIDGDVRTVRVDRVFRAGDAPRSAGEVCWWIVDFKTAHEESADSQDLLPRLRPLFAPQVESYAAILRKSWNKDARVFAGIYYPLMLQLDWWEL